MIVLLICLLSVCVGAYSSDCFVKEHYLKSVLFVYYPKSVLFVDLQYLIFFGSHNIVLPTQTTIQETIQFPVDVCHPVNSAISCSPIAPVRFDRWQLEFVTH